MKIRRLNGGYRARRVLAGAAVGACALIAPPAPALAGFFTCTAAEVAVWVGSRIHVRCNPGDGVINFFALSVGNPDTSHGASPATSEPWASAVTRLAALPNTTAKLSGVLGVPPPPGASPGTVSHIRPYYDFVLSKFGPSRLMFASDWPPCTLEASYAQVCAAARSLTAGLSNAEREAIFSRTARRSYRLG